MIIGKWSPQNYHYEMFYPNQHAVRQGLLMIIANWSFFNGS
jgi:hypothetical protein